MEKRKDLSFSVSATTRPPRPTEQEGVHYYFISEDKFEEMIANDEFVEYDRHNAACYGTPLGQLEEKLARKLDSITEANWQMLPLHVEFQGAHILSAE